MRILGLFYLAIAIFFHVSYVVAGTAYSHLDATVLVVSANALSGPTKALMVVTSNRVGINSINPSSPLDIRDTSNNPLFNVKTSGRVGIGTSTQTQALEVVGNVNMKDGAIIYSSATSGQTNTDWRLIYRDDCNSYVDGSTTGWISSANASTGAKADYNEVSTLGYSGYRRNVLGGPTSSLALGSLICLYKEYALPTHTWVKVIVEYYSLGTWDAEYGYVKCTNGTVGGTTMLDWKQTRNLSDTYPYAAYGGTSLSGTPEGIVTNYEDVIFTPILIGRHTSNTLRVIAGTNLSESAQNESFGIGSVEIWIR